MPGLCPSQKVLKVLNFLQEVSHHGRSLSETLEEEIPGGEEGCVNQTTRHGVKKPSWNLPAHLVKLPVHSSPQLLSDIINERLQAGPVEDCLAVPNQPREWQEIIINCFQPLNFGGGLFLSNR